MDKTPTVIEGKGQNEAQQALLVLMLAVPLLIPLLLMAGGLMYVGIGSFFRKDWQELHICLPAGIALLIFLFVLPLWLWHRSPRWIHGFRYTEGFLEVVTKPGEPPVTREIVEIAGVSEVYDRRTTGYLICFRDGHKIAVNWHVPNAEQLFAVLQQDLAARR